MLGGKSISNDGKLGLESRGTQNAKLGLHGWKRATKKNAKSPNFMSGSWARKNTISGLYTGLSYTERKERPKKEGTKARELTQRATRILKCIYIYSKYGEGFFFSFYSCTCSTWKFLGQGSNWSSSGDNATATATPDPSRTTTCGYARSLIHWARPGIKPAFSETASGP